MEVAREVGALLLLRAPKQIEALAGSGFSGTLEVQTDGADAPLSFQWDYIHTRKNSETVEQQPLGSPEGLRQGRQP